VDNTGTKKGNIMK